MNNMLEIFKRVKEYCDTFSDFSIYDYSYYLGIVTTKSDLSDKEILELMEICSNVCGDHTDPVEMSKALTEVVFIEKYLTLEELKKISFEDIYQSYFEDKMYRLQYYLEDKENEMEMV